MKERLTMAKENGDQQTPYPAAALHGDALDCIISKVRVIDLLPAYYVCKEWGSAVRRSLANASRVKAWLVVRTQSSHNPSLVITRAYDPESCEWIEIPRGKAPFPCLPIRSSHSKLMYALTTSKLWYSSDVFGDKWYEVDGPKIWRSDPVVVKVGSYLVVAGGTYDFEDDPLAVEVYDTKSQRWEICQSIPDAFTGCATSTWLSVAESEEKLFLLAKTTGIFSVFDSKTRMWGKAFDVRPTDSLFFSLIGFRNDRLVLVGLVGDLENIVGLWIWEVHCETLCCKKTSEMPSQMLEELMDSSFSSSSIDMSVEGDVIYICNQSNPKTVFICELTNGSCSWARVLNSTTNDENVARRFLFTSSKIGFDELQRAFRKIAPVEKKR